LSPDGLFAATACGGAIRIWSLVGGVLVSPPLLHESDATAVGFSADGDYLVSHCAAGICVWDLRPTPWTVTRQMADLFSYQATLHRQVEDLRRLTSERNA
jgi:WD40 repeat protein